MAWFLYLLECRDGSLYTGIAVDVEARYAAHASGRGARYTRSHPPRRILLVQPHPDRSSASKAEYAMKQLSAAQKRACVLAQAAPAAAKAKDAPRRPGRNFRGRARGPSGLLRFRRRGRR
ncbi:MAG TPA: GIY-YIG nuclease family protein [Burkholderiales bacterium]|jgi:putative endonuclease|nr:GIY-YIG nuclease family protein [Burkholderiales bacterium]